jgi:uncharacterized membrane protein
LGGNVTLYVYVGNHEGKTENYTVLVKLGDKNLNINNTTPLNAPILEQINYNILDGRNQTSPILIKVQKAGLNQKLVFELWRLAPNSKEIVYDGRWVQITIDVTN